ncbi:MAG TPA: 4Fe-4S dicluster domain-containing protein [Clostridia bacterium]|nr:4Fe-4S dicluster domain-containing protein [Clostridia bacterium]
MFDLTDDFERTGVPSLIMAAEKFPTSARMKKGRVAVVECYRRIPCNPCETSCPSGAIVVGDDINAVPAVDHDRCTGCGLCLVRCPGLAIMLVDASAGDGTVEFSVPHEFLPLPQAGDAVDVANRAGEIVCAGTVTQCLCPPAYDKTPVLRFRVDEAYLMAACAVRLRKGE